jgi:hypothetical protein
MRSSATSVDEKPDERVGRDRLECVGVVLDDEHARASRHVADARDEEREGAQAPRRGYWSACGPSPVDASDLRTRSHHLRHQRCLVSAGTASPAYCGCVGGIATHSCGGGPLPSHSAHAPSTTVKRGVTVTSSRPGCAAQMRLMLTSTTEVRGRSGAGWPRAGMLG